MLPCPHCPCEHLVCLAMVSGNQAKKTATLPYLDVIDQQHDVLGQVKVAQVEHNGIAHDRLPEDSVDLSKQTRPETRTNV